MLGCLGRIGRI